MQTSLITIIIIIIVLLIIIALLYWLFGRKRYERYYFAANEVVFQITHPATTPPSEIVAAMKSFLRPPREAVQPPSNALRQVSVNRIRAPRVDRNWRNRLQPPTEENSRIITFPTLNGKTFSLVPISLVTFSLLQLVGHGKMDLRPNDVLKVLDGAYNELPDGSITIGKDIILQSITPNWFAKNLHHGGATGGPGSWPLEATASQSGEPAVPTSIQAHEFRLAGPKDSLDAYKPWAAASKVHVAILDTAPTNKLKQDARSFMPPTAVMSPGSSLIQYLFTILDIRPYSNPSEFASLVVYTPAPYHYAMPDHGTYVTGIIRTIAPSATLHLYEVLNAFGLGTLTSIAQGLVDAVRNHYKDENTPLIINCSFMLDLVDLKQLLPSLDIANLTTPNLPIKSVHSVLEWITGLKNVVVVAAAGNEARPNVRPYASYPAAFKNVIGVGAVPKAYPKATYPSGQFFMPASYSNFSYNPQNELPKDGFMTLGGELDNPNPKQDEVPFSTKGVLGVYVGELLKDSNIKDMHKVTWRASDIGWAYWAGASFAAPIITGLLAAKPGDLIISPTTRPGPYVTVEGENVIVVEQG